MQKVLVSMLTTVDNPYDPFTQFAEWYAFDTHKGYNTCAYIGRIARTSYDLTDPDYRLENEFAIDEILQHDYANIYKRVSIEKEVNF